MAHDIIQLITEDHDNFIYIIADRQHHEAMVVDPAWDAEGIKEVLAEENLQLVGILLTHSHHDHVNAVPALYDESVSLFINAKEYPLWKDCPEDAILVSEGDEIQFADTNISVIDSAGHTAGGTCYRIGDDLLTGDSLFIYGCGRADLPSGDAKALFHSLQKLKQLPPHTRIWAGHDYGIVQESTLGEQLAHNPFLMIDNEADFIRYRLEIAKKTRSMPFTPMQAAELADILEAHRP